MSLIKINGLSVSCFVYSFVIFESLFLIRLFVVVTCINNGSYIKKCDTRKQAINKQIKINSLKKYILVTVKMF